MNCGDIERTLAKIQAEKCDEHLPMEDILNAMREDEYGERPFSREHGLHDELPQRLVDRYGWNRRFKGR